MSKRYCHRLPLPFTFKGFSHTQTPTPNCYEFKYELCIMETYTRISNEKNQIDFENFIGNVWQTKQKNKYFNVKIQMKIYIFIYSIQYGQFSPQ